MLSSGNGIIACQSFHNYDAYVSRIYIFCHCILTVLTEQVDIVVDELDINYSFLFVVPTHGSIFSPFVVGLECLLHSCMKLHLVILLCREVRSRQLG